MAFVHSRSSSCIFLVTEGTTTGRKEKKLERESASELIKTNLTQTLEFTTPLLIIFKENRPVFSLEKEILFRNTQFWT